MGGGGEQGFREEGAALGGGRNRRGTAVAREHKLGEAGVRLPPLIRVLPSCATDASNPAPSPTPNPRV